MSNQPQAAGSLRLRAAIWPFAVVIATQMMFAAFSVQTLSAIRIWLQAAETWSRSEQAAAYELMAFAVSGDQGALARYRKAMAVPLAYLDATSNLLQDQVDTPEGRAALVRAGNTPNDVKAMALSVVYLRRFAYMEEFIALAERGEALIVRLETASRVIAEAVARGDRPAAAAQLGAIEAVNAEVHPIVEGAIQVLDRFAQFVEQTLMWVNLGLAFGLTSLTVWRVRRFLAHRRSIEGELAWQASHDTMTGIGNRRAFEERLNAVTADERRAPFAVLFLDFDQFKIVNDTCGHRAGDELLRRLCAPLRKQLGEADVLARLGGDEFSIFVADCPLVRAIGLAETLRAVVQDFQFVWEGRVFKVTASIGLVHVDGHPVTTGDVMRAADMACFLAKEKGRNRVHVHRAEDQDIVRHAGEMSWVQRIHQALEEDRFCLYAQDIVPLGDRRDEGLHIELLIRLRDETGSLVPPGSFLPAAERFGLMGLIDRWVVKTAFKILAERMADPAAEPIACCAINLSGATIGDDAFLEFIEERFAESRIPPAIVCFEITETSAITNLVAATAFVNDLRALGCRFSLDDFGSGMSSFAYLKHLPVDFLKIDGGFVRNLLDDKVDRSMVEAINQIGHVMGKHIIAEYVETLALKDMLCAMGVDYGQGFGIARPKPFDPTYRSAASRVLRPERACA